MLDTNTVHKLQSDYHVADGAFISSEVSFDEYVLQCRNFITQNIGVEYSSGKWTPEEKDKHLKHVVSTFVDKHKVKVNGYVSKDGVLDSSLLLTDLIDVVTGAGILKEALEDTEIDEIQINDANTIYVARKGILEYYVDKNGRVMRFIDNEEIHIVLNRLIDDGTGSTPQFTDGNPILNVKTAKDQYRLSAVHHVANTRDKPPHNMPITTSVIRKFKETNLVLDDLIKHGAVTEGMGRLLDILGRAELKLFCVGPTGSGKTTLLRIIADRKPLNKRIILVQNPTEISFMERDEYGRNIRNVVHWEVITKAALDMLVSNSLRFTPETLLVGEAREPNEFSQIQRVARTGHNVLGTFHAESARDAVERFATELSSNGGLSYTDALRLAADSMDIVVSQFRFPDGRRRIMEISEVTGVDRDGNISINTIYEFRMDGNNTLNSQGLVDVGGDFFRVGALSQKTIQSLYKSGIPKSDLEDFINVPEDDVLETKEV